MNGLEEIDKGTQKLIIGSCIFIVGVISLFIGICLAPSPFGIPFGIVGAAGMVIGAITLIACLIEWWDKS